ncbi:LOW QUALITY PROTEIN: hypothetical protein SETIT_5G427900v2 [Setaria italica]|uniref:Secreted protein n=1 Tax=Setaria italica TaxID=4555 RepID=A0A368RGS5_SETIT|nr:LOW QUALITY PROTEIN: hypothetical protein SETIT_5G427900v2 [Setaria italica]
MQAGLAMALALCFLITSRSFPISSPHLPFFHLRPLSRPARQRSPVWRRRCSRRGSAARRGSGAWVGAGAKTGAGAAMQLPREWSCGSTALRPAREQRFDEHPLMKEEPCWSSICLCPARLAVLELD